MLNFWYVLRLLAGIGAVAPTIAAVPLPQAQLVAGIIAVVAECATIILDRSPKIGA